MSDVVNNDKDNDNDVCAICYDELPKHQCFTLECDHTLHSKCVIAWFRGGNKTCPHCRDTGKKDSEPISIPDEWVTHPEVQLYLTTHSDDLTLEIISNAHYRRDIHFGMLDRADDHYYNYIVNKLGLSDDHIKNSIEHVFRSRLKREIDDLKLELGVDQTSNVSSDVPANQEVNWYRPNIIQKRFREYYENENNLPETKIKRQKCVKLTENKTSLDTRDLYKNLDIPDMIDLGW